MTSINLPNGTTHSVCMSHTFFCSCHGKGPSDAETAVVKTAGRTAEENDVYLAFPVDFYNLAKLKLEGLVPPAVADKKRHSLFRRRIHFVETGKALRVNTEFFGLEGKVANNHSFKGTGRLGKVEVRWLPCSCAGCFPLSLVDTPCTHAQFNLDASFVEMTKTSKTDTAASDLRITERTQKLTRRMQNEKGGCATGICAAFIDSADGQCQWDLVEIDDKPRNLEKGDAIDGEIKRSGSKRPADVVVRAFRFEAVPDTEDGGAKKRRFYKEPAAERCSSDLSVCTDGPAKAACSKWHGELMYVAALRPPFISAESRKSQFKRLKRGGAGGGAADFQLAHGIWKSFDTVCRSDEAFVRQSSAGGNLPVAR